MLRVDQKLLKLPLQHCPHRPPIHACSFHRHMGDALLAQPVGQHQQIAGEAAEHPDLPALTVFWCTSSPAQRAYTTCMALPPGPLLEEAFSLESLLCVLTASAVATIPCSSRLPGQTHLRAYRHHCLKRPSAQKQSKSTLLRRGLHFHPPCDRHGHERLILRWTRVFFDTALTSW